MANAFATNIPTEHEIENIKVGDLAPYTWGNRLSEVKEVVYKGNDIEGTLFVYLKLKLSETSTVSESYKVGRQIYNF